MPNKYNYNIDPDISKSETLPSSFYKDPNVFEDIKSKSINSRELAENTYSKGVILNKFTENFGK